MSIYQTIGWCNRLIRMEKRNQARLRRLLAAQDRFERLRQRTGRQTQRFQDQKAELWRKISYEDR